MRKYYIALVVVLGLSLNMNAQNRMVFNHYLLNPETFNPGYMDIHHEISATGLFRAQYIGQGGMASDAYVNAHYHLGSHSGIGLTFNNQNINSFNSLEVGANYVYHAWLSNTMALGVGLQANFYQQGFNPSIYHPLNPSDVVLGDERKVNGVNFGVGASLQDKNLTVNLSMPRIFANGMVDSDMAWKAKNTAFYLSGSYRIMFNKWFTLTPGVLMRAGGGAPANLMIDVYTGLLEEKLILGAGYSTGQNVHVTVGYQFDFGLRISYNLETPPFSKMVGLGTSHELGIGFYSLFEKPGFRERKIIKKNGKVKGMRVIKYKGNSDL